ncbi:MAG: N-acetylmuramidase domain-containing protein [Candidatus Aenigmatarchaeota archaeon]
MCVENSSRAFFGPFGRPIIRFELHLFLDGLADNVFNVASQHFLVGNIRFLDHYYRISPSSQWVYYHTSQEQEYIAFTLARAFDNHRATLSTSYGIGQIMGFHYQRLGFLSPNDMYLASFDKTAQEEMFIKFILSNRKLVDAINSKDFDSVARIYNGSANVQEYASRLRRCYSLTKT